MTTPTTPVDHRKIADEIDARLVRVWEVYNRIRDEAFNLNLLALIHYLASLVPDVAFIELEVTDQGGDTMTFGRVGLAEDRYLAWRPENDGYDTTEIDGQSQLYVVLDESDEALEDFSTIDTLGEYAMAIEEYQLTGHSWFERIGNRHSGRGRIWIAPALLALTSTYEAFIGETLDPTPDADAVSAWAATIGVSDDPARPLKVVKNEES